MKGVQDTGSFNRLVAALEPWLDQIVIVGGWAHQLYRLHPSAQQLDYPPLTTVDTDIAVPAKLPVTGQDIRERLLARDSRSSLWATIARRQPTITWAARTPDFMRNS